MGFFSNVSGSIGLLNAYLPLLRANNEAEFRRLLPAARAASNKVWPSGAQLRLRPGTAKEKLYGAAAASLAAENLLRSGNYLAARQAIESAVHDLQNVYE